MINTLVVGATQSGKSFLAKFLTEMEAKQEGMDRLVFDPKNEKGSWQPSALHTTDQDEYISHYWGSRECVCVVDECHVCIGLHNKPFIAFAMMGSGQKHHNWFITQQVKGLAPALRGECTELYAFRCGPKNADDLVETFIHPELANCPNLKKYEFYHLLSWGEDGDRELRKGMIEI